ncbi:hypothetical protein LEP3755_46730 [Leptolyngbya sp. NIES-3755]|nr:hypothetical protein LEP3755_46730 [Leptolyngbya sp. NIES-3755]
MKPLESLLDLEENKSTTVFDRIELGKSHTVQHMNLSSLPSDLTWHLFLETIDQGKIAAWVAELPECRVVADSQTAAIAALEDLLKHRMTTIQVLPLQASSENAWSKLAGLLKDDASFIEWSDRFWAEKQGIDEDEELSIEDSLRVM